MPSSAFRHRRLRVVVAALIAVALLPLWPADGARATGGHLVPGDIPADVLAQPVGWQVLEAVPGSDGVVTDTAVGTTGAPTVWNQTTGADTVIALIDTGVAPIPALEGAIAGEVDFTGSGGGDGYGHGTFMASLIAGRDERAPGVAPEAGVLSLKVADQDGNTHLGTVLGALEWLAGPGRALGIEVAVLAAGVPADSPGGAVLDLATQRLANLGVTVVTAAGNGGSGQLSAPASSPTTVSVGALDDAGTVDRSDDVVAGFSGSGNDRDGVAQPDLLAGGVRVVGAIGPDSVIARDNPQAVVHGDLFRGSGTSMATALAGGVAALVSDRYPQLDAAGIAAALMAEPRLHAEAALTRAARQTPADAVLVDPAAAADFAVEFTQVAEGRAAALATVERDRNEDVARAEQRHADRGPGRSRAAVLDRQLEHIHARADRAAGVVGQRSDRELDRLVRRLRREVVAAPTTAGWTAAVWTGSAWQAGGWAADRWTAFEWASPVDVFAGWQSLLAGAHGLKTIHWSPALWDAVQWDAVQWDAAVRWDAVQWDAVQWDAVQWDAVQWDAVQWDAVQWDAVQWDAVQWDAVRWHSDSGRPGS